MTVTFIFEVFLLLSQVQFTVNPDFIKYSSDLTFKRIHAISSHKFLRRETQRIITHSEMNSSINRDGSRPAEKSRRSKRIQLNYFD